MKQGKPEITAEAITAIFFDPIPAPQPAPSARRSFFSWSRPTSPVVFEGQPQTPRYRSLNEAKAACEEMGLSERLVEKLTHGIHLLAIGLAPELEREYAGFSRKNNIEWNVDDAYLGIRLKNTDLPPLTSGHSDIIAAMRRTFRNEVNECLTTFAATFLSHHSETASARPSFN